MNSALGTSSSPLVFHISTGTLRSEASAEVVASVPTVGWARANRSGNWVPSVNVP